MNKQYRAIAVDDEPLALKRIENLLKEDQEVELLATLTNGRDAITEINKLNPNLLFLDIQMPEIDGFEILKNIDLTSEMSIVFVTAYDEYALKAFEIHAIDYLLKPFKKHRFFKSLSRAKNNIQLNKKEVFSDLLKTTEKTKEPLSKIIVKASGKYILLKTDDIDWIESKGNYIEVQSGANSYVIRETMKNMIAKLDSTVFYRIHRSIIVNVNKVKEIEPWFHGDYHVTMYNGKKLTMSRNYKDLISIS